MEAKAKRLAKKLNSQDHWAKPYYSDISTFKPGVRRVFVGINGKGDKYSLKYDKQQNNRQRLWSGSRPLHNAYLDECWGDGPSGTEPKGQSSLQIAAQRVFEAMYGKGWKGKLRNTPRFNLIPVSSNGTKDPKLSDIWDEGVEWGIELIEYLKPESIILYGNAKTGKSVWAVLQETYGLRQVHKPVHIAEKKYYLKQDTIGSGSIRGIRVVSMPHLSYMACHLPVLERELSKLRPFQ